MKYKKLLTNFSKKPILFQVALLILLLIIVYLFKPSLNLSQKNSSDLALLTINLETEKRSFEGEVIDDMTMLDALNAAVSVGKIKLNYAIDELGNVNIMEIDGHTNGVNNKYFVFYLNSKKISPETLNKEKISHGDSIEIRNE